MNTIKDKLLNLYDSVIDFEMMLEGFVEETEIGSPAKIYRDRIINKNLDIGTELKNILNSIKDD